ncbi:MAG: signal peptidase I [Verrucomicrobia bacterium]|nr:signal peptidase I [Verrucomicrobiota bacterium]
MDYSADYASGGNGIGMFGLFIYVAIIALVVASMWMVFTKAGKPGWAAIVPIYNMIVLLEIAGKPLWWVLLLFVPFVNFVVSILVYINLAKAFGKGGGFAAGLILLPIIFFPILGFGSAEYQGVPAPATQV